MSEPINFDSATDCVNISAKETGLAGEVLIEIRVNRNTAAAADVKSIVGFVGEKLNTLTGNEGNKVKRTGFNASVPQNDTLVTIKLKMDDAETARPAITGYLDSIAAAASKIKIDTTAKPAPDKAPTQVKETKTGPGPFSKAFAFAFAWATPKFWNATDTGWFRTKAWKNDNEHRKEAANSTLEMKDPPQPAAKTIFQNVSSVFGNIFGAPLFRVPTNFRNDKNAASQAANDLKTAHQEEAAKKQVRNEEKLALQTEVAALQARAGDATVTPADFNNLAIASAKLADYKQRETDEQLKAVAGQSRRVGAAWGSVMGVVGTLIAMVTVLPPSNKTEVDNARAKGMAEGTGQAEVMVKSVRESSAQAIDSLTAQKNELAAELAAVPEKIQSAASEQKSRDAKLAPEYAKSVFTQAAKEAIESGRAETGSVGSIKKHLDRKATAEGFKVYAESPSIQPGK